MIRQPIPTEDLLTDDQTMAHFRTAGHSRLNWDLTRPLSATEQVEYDEYREFVAAWLKEARERRLARDA